MNAADAFEAPVLGLVEGLTEFIPVSSTGHLLLLGHFMDFEPNGKTFDVLIQLGAILAIPSVYFSKLLAIASPCPAMPEPGVSSSACWSPSCRRRSSAR
jgi:undecaprenyl-diphosphatase